MYPAGVRQFLRTLPADLMQWLRTADTPAEQRGLVAAQLLGNESAARLWRVACHYISRHRQQQVSQRCPVVEVRSHVVRRLTDMPTAGYDPNALKLAVCNTGMGFYQPNIWDCSYVVVRTPVRLVTRHIDPVSVCLCVCVCVCLCVCVCVSVCVCLCVWQDKDQQAFIGADFDLLCDSELFQVRPSTGAFWYSNTYCLK